MLTTTRDMIMPTAITGSYPRPLWFDASLHGRSFKAALGDSLFREQYLDAVAAVINAQEAAGLDIVTDGDSRFDLAVGGKSWFFYPIERLGGITRPPLDLARLDGPPRAQARPDPVGGAGGLSAGDRHREARAAARSNTPRSGRSRSASATARSSSARSARRRSPAMLWDEHYHDDKALVLDLCDIMNAEFTRTRRRRLPGDPGRGAAPSRADDACPTAPTPISNSRPRRSTASSSGVEAEIWAHTCWGNPNQQRVYWEVPSYERALPASAAAQRRRDHLRMRLERRPGSAALRQIPDRQEDRHRRRQPLQHDRRAARARRRADPQGARIHPARAAGDHHRLRLWPRGAVAPHRLLQMRLAGRRAPTSCAANWACPKPTSAPPTRSSISPAPANSERPRPRQFASAGAIG